MLIKQGKKVYLVDRNEPALAESTKELGAAGSFVIDLADISALAPFAEKVVKEAPEIDCLINNAAIQAR